MSCAGSLALYVLLFVVCALPIDAQDPRQPSMPSRPAITLTPAQRAVSDSLVRAYAARDARLRAAGDTAVQGRLSPARRALRDELREALRANMTPVQRATYDAWYTKARADFEARRPPVRTRPTPP